jgi:hypothetical protein
MGVYFGANRPTGYSKRQLYIKLYGSPFRGPGLKGWTPPAGMKWRGRGKNKDPLPAKPARRNFDIGSY